jgi:hypothetical protein
MSSIGYRKQGDTTPHYNPERDFAYVTPAMLVTAIELMELDSTPEVAAWRQASKIVPEEVAAVSDALARAQKDFVNAVDPVSTFEAALRRHGFFDVRFVVRQLLFSYVGQVVCAAWFKAVREVSIVGEPSPAQTDMSRFAAAVRVFCLKETDNKYDVAFLDQLKAEPLKFQNDVLQAKINDTAAELEQLTKTLQALKNELDAPDEKTAVSPRENKRTMCGWLASVFRIFISRSDDAKVPDAQRPG